MKVVVKQVTKTTEEEQVLEITKTEFAEVAARECSEFLHEGIAGHEDGMDMETRMVLSLAFADFSSKLMHRLFAEEAEG